MLMLVLIDVGETVKPTEQKGRNSVRVAVLAVAEEEHIVVQVVVAHV